jgi:hypothetical protein
MLRLLREIDRRDRVLSRLGWLQIALLVAMAAAIPFDDRTLLGLSPWIKPIKFAASIAIYAWTLAWFMPYLTGPAWAKALVRWGTALAMTVEIICIAGQSLRGTTSHFNDATPFDGAVFSAMGLFIFASTLLDVLLLVLFFVRQKPLPRAYLWGIRLGFVAIILAGGIGGLMVARLAHTVGAADGGPGLPLVNWSTQWGDLRISHALGLHALQILPLVGYALGQTRWRLSEAQQLTGLLLFALVYGLLGAATLWQALDGRPFLGAFVSG